MDVREWPLWVRCQLGGLLWAGFMYGAVVDGPRTVVQGLICLVGGVAFGLVLWLLAAKRDRRLFGDLSGAERAAAVEAVRAARPPDDPRLGEAAMRLAGEAVRSRMGPVAYTVYFGFFVLLSVYLGIAVTPWGWGGVVFWPVAGLLSWRAEWRQRRAGERFLAAVAAGGAGSSVDRAA